MCNVPLCHTTIPCFFGNHNSLFLLAHYNSLHCALGIQAKKRWMLWFTVKNHSEKTCIGYSTRFSTRSFANGLRICFSHGMYQLGICGYRGVICHSDVAEIKNDIIAGGMK